MLWKFGGLGGSNAADATREAGGAETAHIPTVLAGVLIVSGAVLFFLDKAGFRFAVEASGGRG